MEAVLDIRGLRVKAAWAARASQGRLTGDNPILEAIARHIIPQQLHVGGHGFVGIDTGVAGRRRGIEREQPNMRPDVDNNAIVLDRSVVTPQKDLAQRHRIDRALQPNRRAAAQTIRSQRPGVAQAQGQIINRERDPIL